VQRGSSGAAGAFGGLVGALIVSAFGGFHCPKCGPIPGHEFPPETRSKMVLGSILMVVCGIALLIGVIWLLVWLASK
jgi:hypothetical protein